MSHGGFPQKGIVLTFFPRPIPELFKFFTDEEKKMKLQAMKPLKQLKDGTENKIILNKINSLRYL